MTPLTRRLTALLIGAALLLAAHLPPQHGHPFTPGHTAIVHRHASLHVAGDPSHPRLNDNDGAIIWIDGSYVAGAAAPGQVDADLSQWFVWRPALVVQRGIHETRGTRIHSPPPAPSGARPPPRHALV